MAQKNGTGVKIVKAPARGCGQGRRSGGFTTTCEALRDLKPGEAFAFRSTSYANLVSAARIITGKPYRTYKAVDGLRYATLDPS